MLSHTLRGRTSVPAGHLPAGCGGGRAAAAGSRSPGSQAAGEELRLLELEKSFSLFAGA